LTILLFTVAFNVPAMWELETVRTDHFSLDLFQNSTAGE
jgi:hypothetical protein